MRAMIISVRPYEMKIPAIGAAGVKHIAIPAAIWACALLKIVFGTSWIYFSIYKEPAPESLI